MKLSVTFDEKHFKTLLLEARARVQHASPEGMHQAMVAFKKDCLEVVPKVPERSGDLKNNHIILPVVVRSSTITGKLLVPGPYAASIYEGYSRWGTPYQYKTPGTGMKWVQSKMIRFSQRYFRIAISYVRRALK